jgi:predicted ribosomally synthesized peptide with SipW-like signal peptide
MEENQMKKILFAVIGVIAAIGMMGGAFAYFTDVAVSNSNVMQAGTLDLQLGSPTQAYTPNAISGVFNSPANLAPGQSFSTTIDLKNAGTIAIPWVFARFCNLSNSANQDLSNYIILNSIVSTPATGLVNGSAAGVTTFDTATANGYLNYWYARGANVAADGSLSLSDLNTVRNFGSGDYLTTFLLLNDLSQNEFNDPANNPALPVGGTATITFNWTLSMATPNYDQGAWAAFEVDFIGVQSTVYPNTDLALYITQVLGP